jgi:hypothetical protein
LDSLNAVVRAEGSLAVPGNRNDVGKGQVYFFATSLNRLVRERRGIESVDGFASLLRAALNPPSR